MLYNYAILHLYVLMYTHTVLEPDSEILLVLYLLGPFFKEALRRSYSPLHIIKLTFAIDNFSYPQIIFLLKNTKRRLPSFLFYYKFYNQNKKKKNLLRKWYKFITEKYKHTNVIM